MHFTRLSIQVFQPNFSTQYPGGQGNFTLSMEVFKGSDFREPYTPQDHPVSKTLSDRLYIQYFVNSTNPNLVVRAETCRATPINAPHNTPQYVFIADG